MESVVRENSTFKLMYIEINLLNIIVGKPQVPNFTIANPEKDMYTGMCLQYVKMMRGCTQKSDIWKPVQPTLIRRAQWVKLSI